jgi:dTDP-4-amino-4,6-dideoxy-D-galactose acyltransferase
VASDSEPCELLPWDSTFFGRRIARVCGDVLTPELCRKIDHWVERHRVDLIYFLARTDDLQTTELAEQSGYQLVDVRITLERSLDSQIKSTTNYPATIRPAAAADCDVLIALARQSHRGTRFYFDSRIPRDKADELYAAWMARDLAGDVLVAQRENEIVGYVTFNHDPQRAVGSIGLTAVAASQRGLGIGQALMESAVAVLRDRGAARMTVVTQGRNIAALRLYGRCGFIVCNLQLYYHRWFTADGASARC